MKELWEEIFDAMELNLACLLWPGKDIGKLEMHVAAAVLQSQGFDEYLRDTLGRATPVTHPGQKGPNDAVADFAEWLSYRPNVVRAGQCQGGEQLAALAVEFCRIKKYESPGRVRPSEAVADFAEWIRSHRPQNVTSGQCEDCGQLPKLADEFCKVNKFEPPRDNRPNWINPDV